MFKKRKSTIAMMMAVASVFFTAHLYSQEVNAAIEISGVTVGGGSVYVAVFSNEQDYGANNRFTGFILDAAGTTISRELNLPAGEYLVSVFQDTNNNEKLDTGLFGIPREPFGFTNYSRGIPGNFQKLKVPVNASQTTITVNIGRYRW